MSVYNCNGGVTPNDSDTALNYGSSSSKSGPKKLEVPDERASTNRLSMLKIGDSTEKPRFARGATSRKSTFGEVSAGRVVSGSEPEGLTLMEQMMEEATAAREKRTQEMRRDQRKDNKTNFHGGGLKKGFLVAAPAAGSKKKKGRCKVQDHISGTSPSAPASAKILPSKESWDMHRSLTTTSAAVESDRITLAGGDMRPDGGARKPGLLLPEVQEAMKRSTSLIGGADAGSSEWLTPELLDKISENPRLAAMLTHPRFAEAVQLMSTRPKDAMAMLASSPEARDSFTDLMALMAEHFTGIGEAAGKQAAGAEAERRKIADGPLSQAALRRATEGGVAAASETAGDKAGVDRVLNQPELRELLMDPSMQRVLKECAEPIQLARYMNHPEYGPKLRLMAQAGLVAFK